MPSASASGGDNIFDIHITSQCFAMMYWNKIFVFVFESCVCVCVFNLSKNWWRILYYNMIMTKHISVRVSFQNEKKKIISFASEWSVFVFIDFICLFVCLKTKYIILFAKCLNLLLIENYKLLYKLTVFFALKIIIFHLPSQ